MYKTIFLVFAVAAVASAQTSGSVSAGASGSASGSSTSGVRFQFGNFMNPFRQAMTSLFSSQANAIKSGTTMFKSVLDQMNNATSNIPGIGAFVKLGTSTMDSAVGVGSSIALSGIETAKALQNTKMDMVQQGLEAFEGAMNMGMEMGMKMASEGMEAMNSGLSAASGLAGNLTSGAGSLNLGVSAST